MEQYKIRITRQLREIRRYIEKELLSPIAAKNTVAAIKEEMQSLGNMPGRIHLTPEEPWHTQGIRRTQIKNYYIYFWIDENHKKVQIIGVIYVKRNQSRQLELMEIEKKVWSVLCSQIIFNDMRECNCTPVFIFISIQIYGLKFFY